MQWGGGVNTVAYGDCGVGIWLLRSSLKNHWNLVRSAKIESTPKVRQR